MVVTQPSIETDTVLFNTVSQAMIIVLISGEASALKLFGQRAHDPSALMQSMY